MRHILILFISILIVNIHAALPDLTIGSVIGFSQLLVNVSQYKKYMNTLRYTILDIAEMEKSATNNYMIYIDKTTAKILSETKLHNADNYNDCLIDDEEHLNITLSDYFDIVNSLFSNFINRINISTDYVTEVSSEMNNKSMCSLPWIEGVPKGTNLVDGLQLIHRLIENSDLATVFDRLLKIFGDEHDCMPAKRKYCDTNITTTDKLIGIYYQMAAVERKLFVMTVFVELIKSICNGVTDLNISIARSAFIRKTQRYLNSLLFVTINSARDLYRCDRTKYSTSSSDYIELQGYKQTVIIDEKFMTANKTCILACVDKNDAPRISNEDFLTRSPYCQGRLTNCKSSGENIEICHAPKYSTKKYDWFKDGNKIVYGNNNNSNECLGKKETLVRYNWDLHMKFYCDPCICTCSRDAIQSPSRYAISLNTEESDIIHNEVITGIKFVMHNNIIYAQIETGKIIAYGKIQEFSNKWKNINTVNHARSEFFSNTYTYMPEFMYFGGNDDEAEYINLEHVYVDDAYVVTGIKFITREMYISHMNKNQISISLAIRATKYNIFTGYLDMLQSIWLFTNDLQNKKCDNSDIMRRELTLANKENPLNYPVNIPNSKTGQYLKFWESDLSTDAGQSTVPFFDGIPIFGTPRIPLSGIGIYYKGPPNSGGFLGFTITTINPNKVIHVGVLGDDK